MTELERALSRLGRELEWPPTPAFPLRLEEQPRRRRRRGLVLVVALVAVAVGIAFAVPPARSAILRFFHLGGVTVERVETLPAAEERPLADGLGRPVSAREAEEILGRPVLLPHVNGTPRLYALGGVVSILLAAPEPVLLSELRSDTGGPLVKKIAGMTTGVEWVQVAATSEGIWIAGRPHVVFFPATSPRLAGNVLLWAYGETTFRLEGPALTKERALRLAREVLGD